MFYVPEPRFGLGELRKVFPAERAEANDAWLQRAADGVLAWHAAKRLTDDVARSALALLAQRLHERGDLERAKALTAPLERLPGAAARHLVLDFARRFGDEARARALEDELLAARALNPERAPEVIERVRQAEGAERALTLGAAAAEWTPHPALVDKLIEIATGLGRTADAAQLTRLREENLAAAAKLETTW
jgi:hypothetical protein